MISDMILESQQQCLIRCNFYIVPILDSDTLCSTVF